MQNKIVKTQEEIELMLRAAQIIDDTYDAVLENVKEGVSEKELADFIEKHVLAQGAQGLSFDTIVAFGENGAEPHHVPTDKRLEKGTFVTIDMGAVYKGYCSDFTRTFALGIINEKQREVYDTVYRAQKLGIAAVKEGAYCKDVDLAARAYIEDKGYGDKFIHTTGHGVGTQVHEQPRLGKDSDGVLEKNTVVTVEPGIYIQGEMGVRIEDMVIVGKNLPLSRHATELIVING